MADMAAENEILQKYCQSMERQSEREIQHLQKRIDELEKLMNTKFDARERAVDSAQTAMEARFESVNEFRATLSDQTKHFVTREVMDANVRDLSRRLSHVENKIAGYDGRIVGYSAGSALIVLILSIVAQILNLGG